MEKIDNFISCLSRIENTSRTENLYFGNSRESEIRKHNLKVYLTKMKNINPSILILGEAPGYKGCGVSGIPFTSEKVLAENKFFKNTEVKFINDKLKLESEISSTIVWEELSTLAESSLPLMWNIFPFHPFKLKKDKKINRTPTPTELKEGKNFLSNLLKIFEIKKIIALGRKPESQLKEFNMPFSYIRHPARGGKSEFVKSFRETLI